MKSTSFKETNKVYGAGGNQNTDQLAVCIASHKDYSEGNMPFIISKFKLSPEELEEVNRTGCIWMSVMGSSLSPIMPMALDPFKEYGFEPAKL